MGLNLIVFNKEFSGNWGPEAPETILRIHGVGLNLVVFHKELQGNWRPETPEASGVISLLLFIRNSGQTGGSGGFRSSFLIV